MLERDFGDHWHGCLLLFGIQVLHILLDPVLLRVTTELLALLGGEAMGRRTGTHETWQGVWCTLGGGGCGTPWRTSC